MFRKELVIFSGLALAVFLLVSVVASFLVREVGRDGEMMAKDTVPGLVNAGEAINRLTENWVNTYRLLGLESGEARARLIRQINANTTKPNWARYSRAIYTEEDLRLFKQVEASRGTFVFARSQCFQLVTDGRMEEAKAFFEVKLRPAFERYRSDAVNILLFNAREGAKRADRLIYLARWTPYALAAFCVMVLLAGVFVGFKASMGAFSGGWTHVPTVESRDAGPV